MPRREEVWLREMLSAARRARRHLQGIDFKTFETDELHFDAVVRQIEIVGEAAKSVSETTCQKYPTVDWRRWKRIRDTMIHAYFTVSAENAWDAAEDLKILIPQLEAIVEAEYGPKN